jgi:hypothetical protein
LDASRQKAVGEIGGIMRHTKLVFTFLILAFALTGCEDEKVEDESTLDELQGTWIGTEVGNEEAGNWTYIVADDIYSVYGPGNFETYVATIEIDDSVHPHSIAATFTYCSFESFIGKISYGLYVLEGDHLTLTAHMPGSGTAPAELYDADGRTWELYR